MNIQINKSVIKNESNYLNCSLLINYNNYLSSKTISKL